MTIEAQPITIRVLSKLDTGLVLTIQKVDGNPLKFALLNGAVSLTGFAMELSHHRPHWKRIYGFLPQYLTGFFEAPSI